MGHVPIQWAWLQKGIDTLIYHTGITTETRKKIYYHHAFKWEWNEMEWDCAFVLKLYRD